MLIMLPSSVGELAVQLSNMSKHHLRLERIRLRGQFKRRETPIVAVIRTCGQDNIQRPLLTP